MTNPGIQPELPSDRRRPQAAGTPSALGPAVNLQRGDSGLTTLIPYTNPRALTAYYCGVFALIPVVGLVLGPIALVLGILGLLFVNANPTAKGTGHAIAGIVLGTITLLFNSFVLLGFLAAIFAA